jgi:hypothetical protein
VPYKRRVQGTWELRHQQPQALRHAPPPCILSFAIRRVRWRQASSYAEAFLPPCPGSSEGMAQAVRANNWVQRIPARRKYYYTRGAHGLGVECNVLRAQQACRAASAARKSASRP